MQAGNAKRHHLYRITNILNGKVYIGQAIKINKRWSSHKTASKACGNSNRKPKQYISSAMHVHGIDNFVFEQIASGTISCTCKPHLPGELFELEPCKIAINILEDELIVQYDCLKINGKGYNIARGGQSGPMSLVPSRKGIHNSPTTEFKNGHKLSSESLQKMSNSLKGRIIPLEHKSILLSNLNNGGGRYRFTKGHIPWNKDLKGMLPFKPNTKLTKIPWANDQKLTELATQHGLTATAKMFGTTSSLLHARLKSRGITVNYLDLRSRLLKQFDLSHSSYRAV